MSGGGVCPRCACGRCGAARSHASRPAPELAEDWQGGYWRVDGTGRRFSAPCSAPECLWPVVIELEAAGGWRWSHANTVGPRLSFAAPEPDEVTVHEVGPLFPTWQDAAADAVEHAGARPDR